MSYWNTVRWMAAGAALSLLPTISMAHTLGEPTGMKAPEVVGASGRWIVLKGEGRREHSKRCMLIKMLSSPTAQQKTALTIETETGSGLDEMSVSLKGIKDLPRAHPTSIPVQMRLHTSERVDRTYAFSGRQVPSLVGPTVEAAFSPDARPLFLDIVRNLRQADSASISISDMTSFQIPMQGVDVALQRFVKCAGLVLSHSQKRTP